MEHFVRRWLAGGLSPAAEWARATLAPLGWLYGHAQAARRRAYASGRRRIYDAGAPLIAVGNLTAGGSGKTPMAAWLLERLLAAGRRPGVLLRGYRAPPGRAGTKAGDDPGDTAGSDEAAWLAGKFPRAIVAVDPDRPRGAARAVAAGADVLVADDAFQHLRLRRDYNLVLLDASLPRHPWEPGGGRCLPAGLLREPPSALENADAFVLTRADQAGPGRLAALSAALARRHPGRPAHAARHRPARLLDVRGRPLPGAPEPTPAALSGLRVAAAAGIGRPEAFAATLAGLGAEVTRVFAFPDHHNYTPADWRALRLAAATDAARLLVTEKDAAKLAALVPPDCPAAEMPWALGVEMEVDDGEALWRDIAARLFRGLG